MSELEWTGINYWFLVQQSVLLKPTFCKVALQYYMYMQINKEIKL